MQNKIGLDCFVVSKSMLFVIRTCKKENIKCYDVIRKDKQTYFATQIQARKKVQTVFPSATYLYTSGMIGMLYRNLKKPSRIVSYVLIIVIWFSLSNFVFRIDVFGEKDALEHKMQQYSKKYQYEPKKIHKMKADLLNEFEQEISWLEVYDKGSTVKIRYATKEKVNNQSVSNQPLIAKKDGLIASFKCDEGYKIKHVNEVVKQGEVIVDNQMPDAHGQMKSLKVSGKVYAYTWQKVIVEQDDNKLPDAINYFSLLLEARDQIHIDIKEDEKVEMENVLQFSKNKGKIKLEILYTLIEDITS